MLNFLRNSVRSWPVKLLFGLLIVSFAGWGIGDMLQRTGTAGAAIKVGQVKYNQREVQQAFYQDMRRLAPRVEGKMTPSRAREMGLMQETVKRMVRDALLSQEAFRLGITVTDARLRQTITANPAFQNDQGSFDRETFLRRIKQSGMSESAFYKQTRQDMKRRLLLRSITAGARPPQPLNDALFRVRNEKRVANTVLVPAAAMDAPDPEPHQLRQWYNNHKDTFMAPEYREVTAVVLTADDLAETVKVSDEALRDAYDARTADYKVPARRSLRQALFDTQETAQKVYDQAQGGNALEAAVAAAEADAPVRDLGQVERDALPQALAGPVFEADVGTVLEPVKTRLGWHVVKVTDATPAHAKPFDAVRDELARDLRMERARDSLYDLANRLEDTLAGGASLEEAARKLDARLVEVDALDRQGRNRQGRPVEGLPDTDKFLKTAFNADPGMPSFLKDYEGGYFILRVDSVTPPTPRPFDKVRNAVAEKWRTAQRRDKAQAEAEQILQQVDSGRPLAKVAGRFGYDSRTTDPFTREPEESPLPDKLVKAVFNMDSPGEATMAPVDQGHRVVALDGIKPADPDANQQAMRRLSRRLRQQMRRDVRTAMVESLKRDFPVEIKRDALKDQGPQS